MLNQIDFIIIKYIIYFKIIKYIIFPIINKTNVRIHNSIVVRFVFFLSIVACYSGSSILHISIFTFLTYLLFIDKRSFDILEIY